MRRVLGGLVSIVSMMVLLGGCAGNAPNWVEKGSAALHEEDEQAIYGVGSIVGVQNEPLAWDAAENRARAEVSKGFQTYTAYLMEDYAASTTAGDFTKSTEEQNVERGIKTFSQVTLSGVRPVDRYKDSDGGTYYVLAKLSMAAMKEAIAGSRELDSEVKEYVKKNAERVFRKLEIEESKAR